MHIYIWFWGCFDNGSHLGCGKCNVFQLLLQSSIQREQVCLQGNPAEPDQMVLGPSLSPNPVLRSGTILCVSAMPFSMTELSSGEPNGLIHKLLLFLPLQLLQLLRTVSMPFIMLSWSHILSAECCSKGTQINSLPRVLFPLLSTVSNSISSVISFHISIPHFLSIKHQLSFKFCILHKVHYAETRVLALNLVFS